MFGIFRIPSVVPGIKPRLVTYRARALSTVRTLWPSSATLNKTTLKYCSLPLPSSVSMIIGDIISPFY